MTIHERMESLADLYVAGGLNADERREIDQHAASCAACATLLRDAREFSFWARGAIAPDAPPADLEDRLVNAFRASGQSKKRRLPVGKRFLKVTGSIAAAVGLVILGNVFTGHTIPASALTVEDADNSIATANPGGPGPLNGESQVETAARPATAGKWAFDGRTRGTTDEFAYFFERNLGEVEKLKAANLGLEVPARPGDDKMKDGTERGEALAKLSALHDGQPGEKLDESRRLNRAAEPAAVVQGLGFGANGAEAAKQQQAGRENLVTRAGGSRTVAPEPVQDNRKIIRNGDVSLEVESYEATYTKLTELVNAEKGQISNANTQKMANGKIQATVTLRIPPERFDAVLLKLKDFGTVRHQDIGSKDVTKQYIDLETRLASKTVLAERLKKLLAEGKGTVKELMEVEVQLGNTNEAIEQIKGEIKYYDNLVGLSTITLRISEKDLGQPFEYVQSLTSTIAVTSMDPDDAYAKAQKEIADAGGQVIDSKMNRQNDGTQVGTIRARVDAEKFPALREALRKLGTVSADTVNQQKTARGGNEGTPKADAPLRKELAVIDLTISSPPLFITQRSQILVETPEVESAYQNSRRAIEAAGGSILDGSLTGRSDGKSATLKAQVDASKFQALVESLKSAGKVKNANVNVILPALGADGRPQLLRERAEIELALMTPPQLIGEEHGLIKSIKDTLANSWTGLLWSIEKLFVGIALAGPWAAILAAVVIVWRRRKAKAASASAQK